MSSCENAKQTKYLTSRSFVAQGINFTNLLAQSANTLVVIFLVPAVILLCHSVSPTKLWPTLPIQTTRKYAQLLCVVHLALYPSKFGVNLLAEKL
jgi:hypothetical protein